MNVMNETNLTVGPVNFSALIAAARESLEDGNTDMLAELVAEIVPGAELVEAEITLFGSALRLTFADDVVTVSAAA